MAVAMAVAPTDAGMAWNIQGGYVTTKPSLRRDPTTH
jgi:hypothetical protein